MQVLWQELRDLNIQPRCTYSKSHRIGISHLSLWVSFPSTIYVKISMSRWEWVPNPAFGCPPEQALQKISSFHWHSHSCNQHYKKLCILWRNWPSSKKISQPWLPSIPWQGRHSKLATLQTLRCVGYSTLQSCTDEERNHQSSIKMILRINRFKK